MFVKGTGFLPDCHCPHCGTGLEIEEDEEAYDGNQDKTCPECNKPITIETRITIEYTAVKREAK